MTDGEVGVCFTPGEGTPSGGEYGNLRLFPTDSKEA